MNGKKKNFWENDSTVSAGKNFWEKDSVVAKPDVTKRPAFNPVKQPTSPISDFFGGFSYGAPPMQQAKSVKTVLEIGLPLLTTPFLGPGTSAITKLASIPLAGALQGTGTMVGQSLEGLAEGRPKLMPEEIRSSILGGAAGQGLGLGVAAAIPKSLAPFAKSYQPEIGNLAKQYGMELPASALTKSRAVPIIESIAGKGLFSGRISDIVDRAGMRLNQLADETVASFGRPTSGVEVGNALERGMTGFENTFRQTKDALYQRAKDIGANVNVVPEKALSTLGGVITDLNNIVGKKPPILRQLAALRAGLRGEGEIASKLAAKGAPPGLIQKVVAQQKTNLTLDQATSTLRDLNTKVNFKNPNPIVQGYEGQVRKIAASLSEDIDNSIASQSPELSKALADANGYYKQGIEKLNSEWGKKINSFIQQGKTSEIAPAILNRSTPVEAIPKIFDTVGPGGTESLRAATMERIIESSKNADGMLTPTGISRQVRAYGSDKLTAIFGSDMTQRLNDISQLSLALGRGQKTAAGSQTAFINRMIIEGISTFLSPLKAIKLIIGDAALSRFISGPGQKLLTSGLKFPSAVAPAVTTGVRIGAQPLIQPPLQEMTQRRNR